MSTLFWWRLNNADMKKAIVLRGPSGSGKSSFARKLKDGFEKNGKKVVIVSADDFFEKTVEQLIPGSGDVVSFKEYQFDPVKLPEAHQMAFGKYLDSLKAGVDVVIADNTFTRLWEVQNYIKSAELAGYPVEVYEFCLTTIDEVKICAMRNSHRVPIDVITRMATSFEHFPGAKSVRIEVGK